MDDNVERARGYFAVAARGMQPAGVRQSNMRAVSRVIARTPGVSNAEIARLTGLAPQTVSAVLTSLDDAGLLTRGPAQRRGGRGQPAIPIYLNAKGAFAIGIEIGWDGLDVALVDMAGRVVERLVRSHDYPDPGYILAELGRLMPSLLELPRSSERTRILGVGVAVPHELGQPNDQLPPPNGQANPWSSIDIRLEVEQLTGLPTRLLSDGAAACWAEFLSRSRPLPANFAFLGVGTFVSAGFIADGRLWERGGAGSVAFGAMLVTDQAGTSRCVEDIASLRALELRLHQSRTSLADILGDAPSEEAVHVLADWTGGAGFALAQAVLNTTTLLAVDVVVLGGPLPHPWLERLADATEAELHRIGAHRQGLPRIGIGSLGRAAAAQGAGMLQIYRRYFSRELADLDEE